MHAIAVSETWLNPSIHSSEVEIPGYTLYRNDRVGKRGGGVGIYIRSDLQSKIISNSNPNYCRKPEYLLAEIVLEKKKILLGVVYRPPKIGRLNDIDEVIASTRHKYDHIIITGDFNANLNANNNDSILLRNIFEANNLTILPLKPTHNILNSSTWIDVMATNNPEKVKAHGQFPAPGISHHDILFLSYSLRVPKHKQKYIRCRNFNNINHDKFLEDARSLPWNEIEFTDDIDAKVDILNTLLLKLMNSHAPVRTIRVSKPFAPWLTPDIKEMMAKRDSIFRKFKRTKDLEMFITYKHLRNRVKQIKFNNSIEKTYPQQDDAVLV